MAVHLNRPPHSARLVAWGRADDGWWACVTWPQRVRGSDATKEVAFAAWVPADAVSQPAWSPTVAIPRLQLAPERRLWPAPPGWPSWYAGVWLNGPVPVPDGLQLVTGSAWRERH